MDIAEYVNDQITHLDTVIHTTDFSLDITSARHAALARERSLWILVRDIQNTIRDTMMAYTSEYIGASEALHEIDGIVDISIGELYNANV